MKTVISAVHNVNKISNFLNKLFEKTDRVNIGLIGDSTTQYAGHGWDTGVVLALNGLGLQRFGTGIIGTGEDTAIGHGANQEPISNNASPSTTSDNGFTASLPSEWHSLISNRGSGSLASTDTQRTFMGALRPFVITASHFNSTNFGFRVHGNNTSAHSRPFEGLTSSLIFQHWYAITDLPGQTGASRRLTIRKQTNSDTRYSIFNINNFNGISGGTFSIVSGSTSAAVTYSQTKTTLQTNIKTAIESAFSIPNASVSVTENSINLYSGDLACSIATTAAGFLPDPFSIDTGTLTSQYQGTGYSGGVITTEIYTALSEKGFFSTLATAGAISSFATLPISNNYYKRLDIVLGASASRDYDTSLLMFESGVSGPWCSLFSAATISGSSSGYASSVLMYLGGRGARTHAVTLQNQSNDFLTSIFQALAEHAGYTNTSEASLLLRVHGGINDRSLGSYEAGTTSVGPNAGLSSDTVNGLADNWQAIINRVHAVYDYNSWSKDNLYWLFTSSPAVESDDSTLDFARQAAVKVSNENDRVAAVNFYPMIDNFDLDSKGLASRNSDGTIDYTHFSYTGFRVYSQVEWGSIQNAYNLYLENLESGKPKQPTSSSAATIYFNGKLYNRQQFSELIKAFYPNLRVD